MMAFLDLVSGFGTELVPIIGSIIALVVTYLVFSLGASIVKKRLLKVAKTKKQVSNVEIFFTSIKYVFVFFLALGAIFYFSGSWTGLGLTLGLFSAAIGFALQRPIAGVAAWVMLVTRRPFEIGDRVLIGAIKGDVRDISLTHVTLKEVGGLFPSEENSGRIIMVPNANLFEQNIVNYTQQDEFVLDQVMMSITYESNLEKAIKIALVAAKEQTKDFSETIKKDPFVRTYFQASGIDLYLRYYTPAKRMQQISSNITQELFREIKKEDEIEFAYPHTEVVFREKGRPYQADRHPKAGAH